jgi:pimeloyl-ACP methyl ester carboxylesterase
MASLSIKYNNKSIHYKLQGEGPCLLLLHGYPDNHWVWSDLAVAWKKQFKLLIPDIPGLGKSDTPGSNPSIATLAEFIFQILIHENIEKCILIGHSMGGYVAIAMAQMKPYAFEKIILVHSHPFADTQRKKNNRIREIQIIRQGRWEMICNMALSSRFESNFQHQHPEKIAQICQIINSASPEGLCWLLEAMINRADCSEWLMSITIPVLICASPTDPMVDFTNLLEIVNAGKNLTLIEFNKSRHMCYWEEHEKFFDLVAEYIDS